MVIVMTDKVDDWIAIEYVREVLDDFRRQLKAGATGSGATLTLTPDDCVKLLGCLEDPPWPNRRPPQNDIERIFIGIHCFKLENGGMPRKRAVAETSKFFGCSKWTVNAALRAQSTKLRLNK